MKAIVVEEFGGPENMVLKDVPKPKPGEGEILVRIRAAGVNPVDTYLRSGMQGYALDLPWTPGFDGAGTVEQVGGASQFKVGDEVYVAGSITGTYAEYCLCAEAQVHRRPPEMDAQGGACLGVPYFTAARALFTKGLAAAGDRVLIHGATGGVGLAALQLASGRDLKIVGSAGSDAGRRLVEAAGALCVDHRDPKRFEVIREHFGGGANLIIEMLADVNLDDDIQLLAPGGIVVVVGSRGRVEIAPRDLFASEGSVTAVLLLTVSAEEKREYAALIEDAFRRGAVKPPIAAVLPLEKASEAHQAIIEGPHSGNIVLETG